MLKSVRILLAIIVFFYYKIWQKNCVPQLDWRVSSMLMQLAILDSSGISCALYVSLLTWSTKQFVGVTRSNLFGLEYI
jgi:hypothetical protein